MYYFNTKRLILRNWEVEDVIPMTSINSDPRVMEFFPKKLDFKATQALIHRFINHYQKYGYTLYAVEIKRLHKLIGFVGLLNVNFQEPFTPAVEIGWRLASEYWNQGYATEAAHAVLKYAFLQLNLKDVVSFTFINNKSSIRVMEKIGLKYDAANDFNHPNLEDSSPLKKHVLYRICKEDYFLSSKIQAAQNQILETNIKNSFGNKGTIWLTQLPQIIESLKADWNLSNLSLVANPSFAYVAKANQDQAPVVIKIFCDHTLFNNEITVLKQLQNNSCIRLLDIHEECMALLLPQAMPGITLKSLYPQYIDFVIKAYAQVIKQLHISAVDQNMPTIHDWLKILEKPIANQIPSHLLQKALHLTKHLLATQKNIFLLHGDLHLDNILEDKGKWLAIDPKGVIGEKEFEIAAFDFINPSELEDLPKLFHQRIQIMTQHIPCSIQRIKDWVFVRLILSLIWSIEDRTDPIWDLALVMAVDKQTS